MANKVKTRKRWKSALVGIALFVAFVLGMLELGVLYTRVSWKFWYPDYAQVKIEKLLTKASLTEEDYELLYRQTGVTRLGVDDMRKTPIGRGKLLKIQAALFAKKEVKGRRFAPFTYMDELTEPIAVMCDLKDGDIIVSSTTRVSWWRYGHAAIVVDGKSGMIAECVGPGTSSKTTYTTVFADSADFLVLRPKGTDELREKVAKYVMSDMMGIPYRFTAGILTKKFPAEPTVSQCAHYVWYAYKKFGIDLDSNGGGLVKAQDMALSENIELVQAFGFDLDKLWS